MKVTVEGHGTFEVNEEKIHALLSFLATASGVRLQEDTTVKERDMSNGGYTGRELLNG